MSCEYRDLCGGCAYRSLPEEEYRRKKEEGFLKVLSGLRQKDISFGSPVFIPDGRRRRASLAFRIKKGRVSLGFNEAGSGTLVDCARCSLLTPGLNAVLPQLRRLLEEIGRIPVTVRRKNKKAAEANIAAGDVWLTEADNGIDVVLEFDAALELGHRMAIFEQAQASGSIIRISHRRRADEPAEPVAEKIRPVVKIASADVYIPAGTFLQPSKDGEQALVGLVLKYLDGVRGRIADLFCGVGTFSYPLAACSGTKITAVDSSQRLLDGFRQSVNRNMISNIEIMTRNLFKYPLDTRELKGFDAVVFDPPRAGASAQVAQLAALPPEDKPSRIIAVSCNPRTFVNDANVLTGAGYRIEEITMVDQFVYSNHSELVALFTKQK